MSVLGEAPMGHNLGAHQHHNNNHDDSSSQDGEGVWSPDIEQAFQEALIIYPTCGRRKHIIQEDNNASKMYGRNELIARHIKMRTGKTRSRKQVSSHIQVLARRKAKQQQPGELSGNNLATSTNNRPHLYNNHRASTSSGTPSPSSINGGRTSSQSSSLQSLVSVSTGGAAAHMQPMMTAVSLCQPSVIAAAGFKHHHHHLHHHHDEINPPWPTAYYDVWLDRSIVTPKIRLVEFSAFIEHRNPTTANANQLSVVGPTQLDELNNLQPPHEHFTQQQQPPVQQHQLMSYPHHHLNQVNNQYTASFTSGSSNVLLQQQLQQPSEDVKPNLSLNVASASNLAHGLTTTTAASINSNTNNNTNIIQKHCYVQIDYSLNRTAKKLENIDISQIQDKFPEIGGPDGLFQRGPADAFFLVKFWADINNDFEYNMDDQNSYFGFSSHFETIEHYSNITCSTKACSYGSQVVEKVDKIYGQFNSSNGRYAYNINRSQMCAFMIHFIKKLRQLPRISQMNSVLENFTVLQVITSESSSNEILLCLAYVFEVAQVEDHYNLSGAGGDPTPPATTTTAKPSYHVYKLTKD